MPNLLALDVKCDALGLLIVCDRMNVRVPWSRVSERVAAATQSQREKFRIIGKFRGIQWPELDDDVSISGLLRDAIGRVWLDAGTNDGERERDDVCERMTGRENVTETNE